MGGYHLLLGMETQKNDPAGAGSKKPQEPSRATGDTGRGEQACSAKGSRRRARETRRPGPRVGWQDRGSQAGPATGPAAPPTARAGAGERHPGHARGNKNAGHPEAARRLRIIVALRRDHNENSRINTMKSISWKIYSAFVADPFPSWNSAKNSSSVRWLSARPRSYPPRARPVTYADTASRRSHSSSRIPAASQRAIAPAIRDSPA